MTLILTRRFGPLFAAQFLGAFNDNLFRTAVVFWIAFRSHAGDPAGAAALATAAGGVFILPYVLIGGLAGDLADKRDKTIVARWVKLAEIALMALGALALALGALPLMFAVVFGLGCHSAIFGPIKYAILPQHLRSGERLAGTGLVEGGTFVAVLLGQVAGGLLPAEWVGPTALALAGVGWLAARAMPPAPPVDRGALDWNPLTNSRRAVAGVLADPRLRAATLGISWFWAVGAIFTTQFAPLAAGVLAGSASVATLFLAAFSVGIAIGSAAIGRLLGGRVSTRWCAAALVVMALCAADFFFAVRALAAGGPVGGVDGLLARFDGWRAFADLMLMAVAGGVLSVPLYGVLQGGAADSRARVIAANNIANAIFQTGGAVLVGAAVAAGVGSPLALLAAGLSALLLVPVAIGLARRDDAAARAC